MNQDRRIIIGLDLLLTVLVVVVMVSIALRPAPAPAPAPLTPWPDSTHVQPTQQEVIARIITLYAMLGELIPPNTPDWNEAERRVRAGQHVCGWAILLRDHPDFEAVKRFACDALNTYWPTFECPGCER